MNTHTQTEHFLMNILNPELFKILSLSLKRRDRTPVDLRTNLFTLKSSTAA